MAEAAFNTIAEIQRMRDAGVPQAQAEAITLSIHSGVTGGVATKADLERVEERLGGEIKLVHKDIDLVRKDVKALDQKIDSSVKVLDKKIDSSVKVLDEKMDARIANAKFDLTWRLLGGFALINGLMFALMRYLPPPG